MSDNQNTTEEKVESFDDSSKQQTAMSRRDFLKKSGLVVGGTLAGGLMGTVIGLGFRIDEARRNNRAEGGAEAPTGGAGNQVDYNQALMYFSPEQFKIVEAATERIFPEDENGPGAKLLGVAFFIDHQLAGDWGFNAREYMQPPFFKGESTQGYQGRLKRREFFDIALRELQNYSLTTFKKSFTDLDGNQQDEVLRAFEMDEVKLTTISASGFFRTLRSLTLEGVYADPLYGGNKNMNGWRLKNYPGGGQMAYTNIIDKEDFVKMEPKSLRDHLH